MMKKYQLKIISIVLSILMVTSSVDLNAFATEINEDSIKPPLLTTEQEEKTEQKTDESADKKEEDELDSDNERELEEDDKTESDSQDEEKDSDSNSDNNSDNDNQEEKNDDLLKEENEDEDSGTDKDSNEDLNVETKNDESLDKTNQDALEDELAEEEVMNATEEGFYFEKSLAGGYNLKLHAEDGVFPEDTTVEVTTVGDKRSLHLESEINIAVEIGYYVEKMLALDITFMSKGEEIQPEDGKVDVSIELPASMQRMSEKAASELRVYHIGEEDEITEIELKSDLKETLSKDKLEDEVDRLEENDNADITEVSDEEDAKKDVDRDDTKDDDADDKMTSKADTDSKTDIKDEDGNDHNQVDVEEDKNEVDFEAESFSEYVFAVITKAEEDEGVDGYRHYSGDDVVADIDELPEDGWITTFSEDELPESYKTTNLPRLKNQNPYGSCWAHSSMALAETNRMKQGLSEQDYSELHLCYFMYNTVTDPLGGTEGDSNIAIGKNFLDIGGNLNFSGVGLANWVGAADESIAPYSSASTALSSNLNSGIAYEDVSHLTYHYKVDIKENRDAAKQLIMDNGALGISYSAYSSESSAIANKVYNKEYNSYYESTAYATNHAVTVVGWDDNFSKDRFSIEPEGDGAWLVRNSWTSEDNYYGFNGYFWLSYYDASLANDAHSFVFEASDNYQHNYQYDGGMAGGSTGSSNTTKAANVFQVKGDSNQQIKAAAFRTSSTNLKYTIEIYKDLSDLSDPTSGNLYSTATGCTTYEGYYTVPLEDDVYVEPGDKFSVVVILEKEGYTPFITYESPTTVSWFQSNTTAQSGQSFIYRSAGWVDYSAQNNKNFRIKAFTDDVSASVEIPPTSITFNDSISSTGIVLGKNQSYKPVIAFTPSNATNKKINWKSSNEDVATVNENGVVTAKDYGLATITATTVLGNVSASYQVTVMDFSITGESNGYYGKTYQYSVSVLPEDVQLPETVSWETSDDKIASIDKNGELIVNEVGSVTIKAKCGMATASKKIMCFPNPPSNIITSVDENSVVTIKWSAVPEADYYVVKRDASAISENIIENGSEIYTFIDDDYKNTDTNTDVVYYVYAYRSSYGMGSYKYVSVGPPFRITYHVGGGTNHSDNPVCFRKNESISLLPATAPIGYIFSGWYKDESFSNRIYSLYFQSSDLDLYAKYTPISYKLNYIINTGKNEYTYTYWLKYDQEYTLMDCNSSKTGYNFVGWNTKSDGTGTLYQVGDTVSKLESTQDAEFYLYAQWEPKEVTVSFDANSGVCATTNKSVKYEDRYGSLPIPTREGYSFTGWYTGASGGSLVTEDTKVTNYSNHKLYAHWTAQKITINFDANGGVCSTTSILNEFGTYYSDLPIAQDKKGYTFKGWYTERNGGTLVNGFVKVTNSREHTLYAHWEANKYTVTFNACGGSVTPTTMQVTYDNAYNTLPVPTKTGATFLGWFTAEEDGEQVKEDSIVTTDNNHILFARWGEIGYTVSFETDGGSVSISSKTVYYGRKYGELPIPEKNGYAFQGWYVYNDKSKYITENSVVELERSHTLKADWKPMEYVVTLDPMGGTCSTEKVSLTYQSKYSNLPIPTKQGYDFEGWYTSAVGGKRIFEDTLVATAANHTLYAHWTNTVYTVFFDALGGTVTPTSKRVAYENAFGSLPIPEKHGYEFGGWVREIGNIATKIETDSIFRECKDITLHALWTEKTVSVTFNLNDSVGDEYGVDAYFEGGDGNSFVANFASSYGSLPTPKMSGFVFAGWYTSADATGLEITSDSIVNMEVDHALYAHWKPRTYKIVFDLQGGSFKDMETIFTDVMFKEAVSAVLLRNSASDIEIPKKMKATFAGWYTEADGDTLFDFDTLISEDTVIYAHWHNKYSLETPTANVPSGEVEPGTVLTLSTLSNGAKIYYTTDSQIGENVTQTNGILFEDAIPLEGTAGETITYYVRAFMDDYNTSEALVVRYTIKDMSGEWGNVTEKDKINEELISAEEVPDELWVTGIADEVDYNGIAQTFPDMHVYYGKILLEEGKSYSVKYKNNVKAGTASVTITGKGNYAGTITKTFVINPLSLGDGEDNEFNFNAPDITLLYNKRVQKGETTVTYNVNGKWVTLKKGTDFTYQYDVSTYDYKNPGYYRVTIVGKGNYCGTGYFGETIVENPKKPLISQLKFVKIPNQQADGTPKEPEIVIYDGTYQLVAGNGSGDYQVVYQNNILPGTATAIITGTGDYQGTKILTYKITAIDLRNVKVTMELKRNRIFNGSPIELEGGEDGEYCLKYYPTRNSNPIILTEGVDYKVNYINNVNAGKNKAQICFTGINGYTGVVKKNFTILPHEIKNSEVLPETIGQVIFKKGGVIPQISIVVDGNDLVAGVDYSVKCTNNTTVNDGSNSRKIPTLVISGKGNYSGSIVRQFTITGSNLSATTMSTSDIVFQNKAGLCRPVLTLIDDNGKKLSAGSDYDNKNIQYTYVEDTLVTQIINKKTVQIARQGENPEVSDSMGDAVDLKKDIIPAGTKIRVTVTGKGYYSGTQSVVFRYVTADITKASVTVSKFIFNGRPVEPTKKDMIVKFGKNAPLAMTDYEIVGYSNNIAKGNGFVTIKGVGNYGGTKTVKFSIVNKSMNYNIVYDNNNAYMAEEKSFAPAATGTMKSSSTAFGAKISNNSYKRNGYVFSSWNTAPDGSGMSYSNNEVFYLKESAYKMNTYGNSVTLYAQWTPVIYTISYPNAIVGKLGVIENNNVTHYTIEDTLTFIIPKREGYVADSTFYMDSSYKKAINGIAPGTYGNKKIYVKWHQNVVKSHL